MKGLRLIDYEIKDAGVTGLYVDKTPFVYLKSNIPSIDIPNEGYRSGEHVVVLLFLLFSVKSLLFLNSVKSLLVISLKLVLTVADISFCYWMLDHISVGSKVY